MTQEQWDLLIRQAAEKQLKWIKVLWFDDYLRVKGLNPESIVFVRVGDFYEAYNEDAETVARVCDIVLTSRLLPGGRRRMVGIPHHSYESCAKEMVVAGLKVELVERVK